MARIPKTSKAPNACAVLVLSPGRPIMWPKKNTRAVYPGMVSVVITFSIVKSSLKKYNNLLPFDSYFLEKDLTFF